jgi:hypothetical protein
MEITSALLEEIVMKSANEIKDFLSEKVKLYDDSTAASIVISSLFVAFSEAGYSLVGPDKFLSMWDEFHDKIHLIFSKDKNNCDNGESDPIHDMFNELQRKFDDMMKLEKYNKLTKRELNHVQSMYFVDFLEKTFGNEKVPDILYYMWKTYDERKESPWK